MKQTFLIKNLLVLICVCVSITISAQRQRNYIYLFDCTKSMIEPQIPKGQWKDKTVLKKVYSDKSILFTQATEFLIEDISRQSKESSITIIPFTNVPHLDLVITCTKDNINYDQVREKLLSGLSERGGDTGICAAWDYAIKNHFDSDKDNYLILLTDGEENVIKPKNDVCCTVEFCNRIKSWNNKEHHNVAIIVSLSEMKHKTEIKEAVNDNNNTFFTDSHLGPFGAFTNSVFTTNIHTLKRLLVTGFSTGGVFPVELKCNDPFFTVRIKDNVISNGQVTFIVEPKGSPYFSAVHEIKAKVISDSKKLNILNNEIFIKVDSRDVSNLDISNEEFNAGKAKTYKSFLWGLCKAKTSDTLIVDLNLAFNQCAIKDYSKIRLSIIPRDLSPKDYEVIFGGIIQEGQIEVLASHDVPPILIVIKESTKEGKHFLDIQGASENLQTINSSDIKKYSNTIRFIKETNWNPVRLLIWWCIIILILGVLLRCIYVFLTPKMKGRISITYPSIGTPIPHTINGCKKFIFSNKPLKQCLFSRLLNGKTGAPTSRYLNPFWTTPIIIKRNNSKSIKIMPNEEYLINGQKRVIPFICRQGKTTIEIKNEINNLTITLKY